MIRCGKGHYYDENKYGICPYCGIFSEDDVKTISFPVEQQKSVKSRFTGLISKQKASVEDDIVTMCKPSEENDERFVVGWLVCTEGGDRGRDYRIFRGNNFVGRDFGSDIRIESDDSVSRNKHCSIVYENKNNLFYVVPMENLVYMDGKVLDSAVQLSAGQEITIGRSTFVFIPFCEEERKWETE